MCGILGVFSNNNGSINETVLYDMINSLKHRGPDSQNIWIEEKIGLAHARLSIQDLSSIAHQPMFSVNRRFVIVFNGEIYNYLELRKELAQEYNLSFKTQSDTEVLINAIEFWGIDKTLNRCVGMFAFAAWDRKEKKLYLVRDRFGEKPLYYGQLGNDFVFASELKAIHLVYRDKLHIDRDALETYMSYSYVPTPFCIYSELKKLEPGTYIVLNNNFSTHQKTYWSAIDVALQPKTELSFQEAVDELDKKLRLTLSQQMLANVPLGTFLSGGVDSSTIVSLMQSIASKPIKTFSIGLNEKRYNESIFAKAVASHLGTNHTEFFVTSKEAIAAIPRLSHIYDEPFADSSQIPTFLVSQLAKKSVTVSLSGDAGDEIFGGYNRYFLAKRLKSTLGNPVINRLIRLCPARLLGFFDYLPQKKITHLSEKLKKIQLMAEQIQLSFIDMYEGFCIQPHEALVLQGKELGRFNKPHHTQVLAKLSGVEAMMLLDTLHYLRDDILVKVDRAAMAVGLETRVPFLDHRIFEFAWSLPEKYKVVSGQGKLVLREVLYRYVPRTLIERPKMGFSIPLEQWLRCGLVDWVENLLDENKLKQQGFLNASVVRRYWNEHKSGKRNWQGVLWNILMFQQWQEYWH